MRTTSEKLIWADKAALAVAAFMILCTVLGSVVALIAVGRPDYGTFDLMLLRWSALAIGGVTVPLWLAFRGIAAMMAAARASLRPRHGRDRAPVHQGSGYPGGMAARMGWR